MVVNAVYTIPELRPPSDTEVDKINDWLRLSFASFSVSGIERNKDADSLHCVLSNLLARGIPTICPPGTRKVILEECYGHDKVKYKNDPFKTDLQFNPGEGDDWSLPFWESTLTFSDLRTKLENRVIRALYYAIFAARMHRTLALLQSERELEGETIHIWCDIENEVIVDAVLTDYNNLLHAFHVLTANTRKTVFQRAPSEGQADFVFSFFSEIPRKDVVYVRDSMINTAPSFLHALPLTYVSLGEERQSQHLDQTGQQITKSEFYFRNAEISQSLHFLLEYIFGFKKFMPGQLAIINRILMRLDVVGLLPTGGGKSLTYQFCALMQPGMTLVIDPINSLMKDQYTKLVEFGVNQSTFINSLVTSEERDDRLDNISKLNYLVLFVSPERFHIQRFRDAFASSHQLGAFVHHVVIDEAHVVSEWGHDFRPSYLKLPDTINKMFSRISQNGSTSHRPTFIALTATASFDVLADVQRELTIDKGANLDEDTICALPPDAIDRKELHFDIVDVEQGHSRMQTDLINSKYHVLMEFESIKRLKYPILLDKVAALAKAEIITRDRHSSKYKGGAIVFCPTRSEILPNGVHAIKSIFDQNELLNVVHYHSGAELMKATPETIRKGGETEVISDNMDKFLNNEANLMVCTKGFGMGIDKKNVRATIHYSMPPSVESFYQEAGRAGRDRYPAKCTLLYHEHDILMNRNFLQNSFRSEAKEKHTSDELLNEIRYEPGFFVSIINSRLKDDFPGAQIKLNPYPTNNDWRTIYINGPWISNSRKSFCYGSIHVANGNVSDHSIMLGTTEERVKHKLQANENDITTLATSIRERTKEILSIYLQGEALKTWLNRTSDAGLAKRMESMEIGRTSAPVIVGFVNDYVHVLGEKLEAQFPIPENAERFIKGVTRWKQIIYSAYDFSFDEDEFVENFRMKVYRNCPQLQKNRCTCNGYGGLVNCNFSPIVTGYIETDLRSSFNHIRSLVDTERAIYRLNLLGVVTDYIVDYSGACFFVTFKKERTAYYINNLQQYYKRYLGEKTAIARAEKAAELIESSSTIPPLRDAIVEFVHQEIKAKRNKAIDYMAELCRDAISLGDDNEFRARIKYYFTSKFLSSNYLPKDSDDGKYFDIHLVEKYLDFVHNPPNGLGGPIDNFKHLRGACARYMTATGTENNMAIQVLNAVSIFALEASRINAAQDFLAKPLYNRLKSEYVEGLVNIGLYKPVNYYELSRVLYRIEQEIDNQSPLLGEEIRLMTETIKMRYQLKRLGELHMNLLNS